ncbi:type III secretory pathway component [Xanthomonas theicola]|uniref:type III secretory pathway component n=1 Tax=Xanthomonas theicola TaxID=56464 RepID=UPI00360F2D75
MELLAALQRRRGETAQAQLRQALGELQSAQDAVQACRGRHAQLQQRCDEQMRRQAWLSAAPRLCIASWLDGERHREDLGRQLGAAQQVLERAQLACAAQQEQVAAARARWARHMRQAQQYRMRADLLERQRAERRELAEDEEAGETAAARMRLHAGVRARRG